MSRKDTSTQKYMNDICMCLSIQSSYPTDKPKRKRNGKGTREDMKVISISAQTEKLHEKQIDMPLELYHCISTIKENVKKTAK
jgi:hypothetical protein